MHNIYYNTCQRFRATLPHNKIWQSKQKIPNQMLKDARVYCNKVLYIETCDSFFKVWPVMTRNCVCYCFLLGSFKALCQTQRSLKMLQL